MQIKIKHLLKLINSLNVKLHYIFLINAVKIQCINYENAKFKYFQITQRSKYIYIYN